MGEVVGLQALTDHAEGSGGPLIFISAAEPSADLHGEALIRATLRRCSNARFVGVAGPRMVEAGCEPIFDMTRHSAMLLGVLKVVGQGIAMLTTSDQHLRRYPFDAAVVIDSPVLHLALSGRANALGIPVLYYVAPQIWAWGSSRIHKLRNQVDRVAAILPFEQDFFRHHGVEATYVGHPLAERWAVQTVDEKIVADIRASGGPIVALLPGSRTHVVQEVLRGQLEVAERIAAVFPKAAFGVSVANKQVAPVVDSVLATSHLRVRRFPQCRTELVRAADLVLVASGTASLEVAFNGRPMIVMYNASRVFYHLFGRWMIRTPHLSLPNILAGREIVPEFMPYFTSAIPIAERAIELLRRDDLRERMMDDLKAVTEPLRSTRASERTAEILLGLVERSHS
ncbi:MAG: lipid-A-disaccharide synthase [Phycisphaerales bacterium]|nr:MAG: lipid-A-disaccharide synthase [Phycisphaerales bacterium]